MELHWFIPVKDLALKCWKYLLQNFSVLCTNISMNFVFSASLYYALEKLCVISCKINCTVHYILFCWTYIFIDKQEDFCCHSTLPKGYVRWTWLIYSWRKPQTKNSSNSTQILYSVLWRVGLLFIEHHLGGVMVCVRETERTHKSSVP